MNENHLKPETFRFEFPEVVNENTNFESIAKPTTANLLIDCSKVIRINSVGIKGLKRAFENGEAAGAHFSFVGITPAVMDVVDLITNFLPKNSEIMSMFRPYACMSCQHTFLKLYGFDEIRQNTSEMMNTICTKCGSEAELDDIIDLSFRRILGPK